MSSFPLEAGSAPARHTVATLAGINVPAGTLEVFQNCFRNFKVPVTLLHLRSAEDVANTPCDGCVFSLDERAPEILSALRSSPRNRNALAYGIGTFERAAAIAHLGINAVVTAPESPDVSRAVEATYLLLVRQLRRYVRVPIVTPVEMETAPGSPPLKGISKDISAGGIAVVLPDGAKLAGKLIVRFVLPELEPLSLPALVCWYAADSIGMQFTGSDGQARVKHWVEQYLGVA